MSHPHPPVSAITGPFAIPDSIMAAVDPEVGIRLVALSWALADRCRRVNGSNEPVYDARAAGEVVTVARTLERFIAEKGATGSPVLLEFDPAGDATLSGQFGIPRRMLGTVPCAVAVRALMASWVLSCRRNPVDPMLASDVTGIAAEFLLYVRG